MRGEELVVLVVLVRVDRLLRDELPDRFGERRVAREVEAGRDGAHLIDEEALALRAVRAMACFIPP